MSSSLCWSVFCAYFTFSNRWIVTGGWTKFVVIFLMNLRSNKNNFVVYLISASYSKNNKVIFSPWLELKLSKKERVGKLKSVFIALYSECLLTFCSLFCDFVVFNCVFLIHGLLNHCLPFWRSQWKATFLYHYILYLKFSDRQSNFI